MLKIDVFHDFQALVLTTSGRSDFLRWIFIALILGYTINKKTEKLFRHIRKLGGVIGVDLQYLGKEKLIQSSRILPKNFFFNLDR